MIDPFGRAREALPPPAQLGFGRHLGPLVVGCEHDAAGGWSPPRVRPLADCTLPVASAAVQYALNAFEGLKAFRGPDGAVHLFRPEAHARRFVASARRLCLPEVEPARFVAMCGQAAALHEPLLPPHGEGALYLRPTLGASESFLGLRAASHHRFDVLVSPCSTASVGPLQLWIERQRLRAAPGGLGAVKTGANYAAGVAALETARARGFDQVVFLDAERARIAETGGSNLFVVLDDRVVTPALDDTILAGITRDSTLVLLRELGWTIEECAPSLDELAAWHASGRLRELFCVGTAATVVAVARLAGEGLEIVPAGGTLVARLRQRLDDLQQGRAPDVHGWRLPVAPSPPGALAAGPPRSRAEARAFALAWAAAWSRRDAEGVLAWFADAVVFVSPRALEVTGAAEVRGKPALRDYWQRALAAIASIEFVVDEVSWDGEARRLGIAYRARIDGRERRVSEQLTFDDAGLVVAGAVYHG
jgi:branched-chain amino acid aminotransferase